MRMSVSPLARLPQPWRKAADWVITIALAIVFVLAFEAEVAKPYRIPSSSMEPTLHCAKPALGCLADMSDRVIANRLAYVVGSPARGQIVVFNAPPAAAKCQGGERPGTFVKRLIGLPGDTITERDGYISVNGRPLAESYVEPALRDHVSGTWHVPAGHYFFMGDDRINSCDSRIWGAVPRRSLIGPVIATYWPPTRIAFQPSGL